jgi:hypothetical protein
MKIEALPGPPPPSPQSPSLKPPVARKVGLQGRPAGGVGPLCPPFPPLILPATCPANTSVPHGRGTIEPQGRGKRGEVLKGLPVATGSSCCIYIYMHMYICIPCLAIVRTNPTITGPRTCAGACFDRVPRCGAPRSAAAGAEAPRAGALPRRLGRGTADAEVRAWPLGRVCSGAQAGHEGGALVKRVFGI